MTIVQVRRALAMAIAAMLIARAPSLTFAAQAQEVAPLLASKPASAPATVDPAQSLADSILAEIGDRAATAPPADLEGIIAFVLSQGDHQPAEIDAALDRVAQALPGAAMVTALDNVRLALGNQRTLRGTAAIAGSGAIRGGMGGSGEVGSSSFSAPVTSGGGGGGTSNYSV